MDLSTHDLKGGTLTTTTPNPAYEIVKHETKEDGQRRHEYELVGVVKEGLEEGVYDTIP